MNEKINLSTVRNVLVRYEDHLDNLGHVSVTEWPNGEGFDLEVNHGPGGCGSVGHMGVTHTQWDALKKAMKKLNKGV